jgi:transposase-like protein
MSEFSETASPAPSAPIDPEADVRAASALRSPQAEARAARLAKFERERLIVEYLNRGVSVAEIAMRFDVGEKRMRAFIREILERRQPHPPEEYVAIQVSRLNEALLVAYSAMTGMNLKAVGEVRRLVRELDRYHGFVAAGRRLPCPRITERLEAPAEAAMTFGAALVCRAEFVPRISEGRDDPRACEAEPATAATGRPAPTQPRDAYARFRGLGDGDEAPGNASPESSPRASEAFSPRRLGGQGAAAAAAFLARVRKRLDSGAEVREPDDIGDAPPEMRPQTPPQHIDIVDSAPGHAPPPEDLAGALAPRPVAGLQQPRCRAGSMTPPARSASAHYSAGRPEKPLEPFDILASAPGSNGASGDFVPTPPAMGPRFLPVPAALDAVAAT